MWLVQVKAYGRSPKTLMDNIKRNIEANMGTHGAVFGLVC